jgi:hypothetical protein
MAMFWVLFVVGMVNVCLGYGLAVCQGYGLPGVRDALIGGENPLAASSAGNPAQTADEPATATSTLP